MNRFKVRVLHIALDLGKVLLQYLKYDKQEVTILELD